MPRFLSTLAASALCLVPASAVDIMTLSAPAVAIEHPDVVATNSSEENGWVLYKQCDARWKANQLGTCSQTICSAGCAMSSVAMMLATRGAGQDPGSLNAWLDGHGGYADGCDIVWGSVNSFGVMTFVGMQSATRDEICNGLGANHGLIANVRGGSHWVLLTGCAGGTSYTVNDPGFDTPTYDHSDIVNLAVYHPSGSMVSAPVVAIDHPLVTGAVPEVEAGWAMYKQCDSRWKGNQLGTCSDTICSAGCAMSSTAMMLKTRGVNVDPGSLNAWLKAHGGYAAGCEIVWGSVDAFGKTKFQGMEKAGEAAICAGLKAGHGVIANVRGGSHWVLLTGCRGGGVFTVNDPGFATATYTLGDILQEAVYHNVDTDSAVVVV